MKIKDTRSSLKIAGILLFIALAVFFSVSPVFAQRAPIDVNLIIDGSSALESVKDEIYSWVSRRLDQILVDGDRITVWSAGAAARIIYTGSVSGTAERDAAKTSIRELAPAGNASDFNGALREASTRQSAPFSYTLLICAAPQSLSTVINNPQGNLLRYSRVEEFSTWRALVVALNLDSRVRRATDSFFNN